MSYWTFSDVFEEQGVVQRPFYGGFGLMAEDGLPKPAFNAFKLLHQLGTQRLANDSTSALVTRRSDHTLVLAVWNLFLPEDPGEPKSVSVVLKGRVVGNQALVYRLDSAHGSLLAAYDSMGRPRYPTPRQIAELRQAAALPPAEVEPLSRGELTLRLPPQGLALIEVKER